MGDTAGSHLTCGLSGAQSTLCVYSESIKPQVITCIGVSAKIKKAMTMEFVCVCVHICMCACVCVCSLGYPDPHARKGGSGMEVYTVRQNAGALLAEEKRGKYVLFLRPPSTCACAVTENTGENAVVCIIGDRELAP